MIAGIDLMWLLHRARRPMDDPPALAGRARRIVLYGAGNNARRFLTELLLRRLPVGVVAVHDDMAALWGSSLLGVPILAPEDLARLDFDAVVVPPTRQAGELTYRARTATWTRGRPVVGGGGWIALPDDPAIPDATADAPDDGDGVPLAELLWIVSKCRLLVSGPPAWHGRYRSVVLYGGGVVADRVAAEIARRDFDVALARAHGDHLPPCDVLAVADPADLTSVPHLLDGYPADVRPAVLGAGGFRFESNHLTYLHPLQHRFRAERPTIDGVQ
jgi:hypothetical protein